MDTAALFRSLLGEIWELLSFQTFISPFLLVAMYYLGAVGMPLLAWTAARAVYRRVHCDGLFGIPSTLCAWVSTRTRAILLGLGLFLLAELAWRMMFELLIAYFQIRDALVPLRGLSGAP